MDRAGPDEPLKAASGGFWNEKPRLSAAVAPPSIPFMTDLARLFYYVFGLITLVGGVQAFLAIGSRASLIAGGISGLLLLLAGGLLQTQKRMPGLILGLVVTLGLAGRFLPKFLQGGGWWPAGVEGILGAVGVLLTVVALIKR